MPKPLVIDLSHYQVIPKDLSGAANAGIAGVIHKATENVVVSDAKAKARKKLAEDAGLLWGVYHFLRPGHIRNQADAFLSKTNLIDDDTLLVCDFEVNGITLDELLLFLRRVESQSGQKPVLYSGNTLKELGGASKHPELAEYRLWIAQYNNKGPTLPKGFKNWWLWQYSDKGKISGINGNVDVNAYQGTARDLRQNWVIKTSAATATATHTAQDERDTSDSTTDNLTDKAAAADTKPNPSTEQNVAVVKEDALGFWGTLKKKITAGLSGIGGTTGLTTYAQQAQTFGLSNLFWERVFWIGVAGFGGWIVIEIVRWFFTVWLKRKRTDALVLANTTPNNSVTVIHAEEADKYQKEGWVIIERRQT